jgi:hypothetical protein
MPTIAERVERWDMSVNRPTAHNTTYSEIHKRIAFYYLTHYFQFLPTLSVLYPEFETRLERWINNVSHESHQRLLFELLPNIAFFSREDFQKLNQAAFDGPILRWIIETAKIGLVDSDMNSQLKEEAHRHTWYCPLSDSMRINDFHTVNLLGGVDYRPDWRSLAKFSSTDAIEEYMQKHRDCQGFAPLKRVVILEDFIGSGAQASDTIQFIKKFSEKHHVLVVPLIACPAGASAWRLEETDRLKFRPVIELKSSDMITNASLAEDTFEGSIAKLVEETYEIVEGDCSEAPRPYGPFGFPPPRTKGTGSLVSLYSNTPANTLPIIHHQSSTWNAIFPRSARIR